MTITHEIDREEVMAYLDGEIATARAVAIRAHLDQCAECRALADELRDVSAGLGEWAVEKAPDTLVAPAIAIGPLGYRANGLLKICRRVGCSPRPRPSASSRPRCRGCAASSARR